MYQVQRDPPPLKLLRYTAGQQTGALKATMKATILAASGSLD
jgi:hypothetical protein